MCQLAASDSCQTDRWHRRVNAEIVARRPALGLKWVDIVEKVVLGTDNMVIGQNLVPVTGSWIIVAATRAVIEESFAHSPRQYQPREPFFDSIGQVRSPPPDPNGLLARQMNHQILDAARQQRG